MHRSVLSIKPILPLLAIWLGVGYAQTGIWTSAAELAGKPTSGAAWDRVKAAADLADPNAATVSDQNSNNNVEILAAGIVFARTGTQSYANKVTSALERLVAAGQPGMETLAWGRETAAYVMAADLVGYRTSAFETWCRNMAEVWIATDGRTMLQTFKMRPNNWGSMAFGSLAAIYVYLGDSGRLQEIRNYWIQMVTGPKPPESIYGSDLSWHVDENNLRLINPQGATKSGLNIDGVIPDDMRRGGSFSNPPAATEYPWEHLQGLVTAARILDRASMSIWNVDNQAIYRVAYCLQVRYQQAYGGWAASGDDEWQLPFLDQAYGTNWSAAYDPASSRIWDHGKIAGWGYVISSGSPSPPPAAPSGLTATAVSESQIDLTWTDNSGDESGFRIERSQDGGNSFSEIAQVSANTTQYSNVGLAAATQYCYRVRSYNGAGASGYSNGSCATTQSAGPVEAVAAQEIKIAGKVTGSYVNTHASDDLYESIEEKESTGKPDSRYSFLEHKWVFQVASGVSVTFFIDAHRTVSSDGDDFVLAYSSNDAAYTNMLTITKTSDDDTYQQYSLPSSLSGTVYIRVIDTDRTPGNRSKDTIYLDHIFIRSESSAGKPSLGEEGSKLASPRDFALLQNFPNPFNPSTAIVFSLSQSAQVTLSIHNSAGQLVKTLASGEVAAGTYRFDWDGTDEVGERVASGVYLYVLKSGGNVVRKKLVMLR